MIVLEDTGEGVATRKRAAHGRGCTRHGHRFSTPGWKPNPRSIAAAADKCWPSFGTITPSLVPGSALDYFSLNARLNQMRHRGPRRKRATTKTAGRRLDRPVRSTGEGRRTAS